MKTFKTLCTRAIGMVELSGNQTSGAVRIIYTQGKHVLPHPTCVTDAWALDVVIPAAGTLREAAFPW